VVAGLRLSARRHDEVLSTNDAHTSTSHLPANNIHYNRMPPETTSSEQPATVMPAQGSPAPRTDAATAERSLLIDGPSDPLLQPEGTLPGPPHTETKLDESTEQKPGGKTQKRISSKHLSRDDRLRVLTLHKTANWDYSRIAKETGFSYNQVRYTCHAGDPTPLKRTGRPFRLSEEQVKELIAFISASETNRQMSHRQLAAAFSHWGVGYRSIKRALERSGFKR
jgi:transposase